MNYEPEAASSGFAPGLRARLISVRRETTAAPTGIPGNASAAGGGGRAGSVEGAPGLLPAGREARGLRTSEVEGRGKELDEIRAEKEMRGGEKNECQ